MIKESEIFAASTKSGDLVLVKTATGMYKGAYLGRGEDLYYGRGHDLVNLRPLKILEEDQIALSLPSADEFGDFTWAAVVRSLRDAYQKATAAGIGRSTIAVSKLADQIEQKSMPKPKRMGEPGWLLTASYG